MKQWWDTRPRWQQVVIILLVLLIIGLLGYQVGYSLGQALVTA